MALLLLACAGCGRACKNDHPYVPYSVEDARADSGSIDGGELALPAPGDAGSRSSAEPARVAPEGATTWKVDGLDLVAPAGRELLYAIVRDFDGDGKKDALALVRPPAPAGKPNEVGAAEIVYYAGSSTGDRVARTVAVAPAPRVDSLCSPVAISSASVRARRSSRWASPARAVRRRARSSWCVS